MPKTWILHFLRNFSQLPLKSIYHPQTQSQLDHNIENFNIQNGFFSLEVFATLMKAGGDSDNVLIQAPVPVPFLDTKRKWKHSTEKKLHKLQKFASLKILIDLN